MANLSEIIYNKLNKKFADSDYNWKTADTVTVQVFDLNALKNRSSAEGFIRGIIEGNANFKDKVKIKDGKVFIQGADENEVSKILSELSPHLGRVSIIGTGSQEGEKTIKSDTLKKLEDVLYTDKRKEENVDEMIEKLGKITDIDKTKEIARKAREIKREKGEPAAKAYVKSEVDKIRMKHYLPEKENYFAEIFRKERAPAIMGGTIAGVTPFFFTKNWVIRLLAGTGLYGGVTYGLARYVTPPKELPEDLRHRFALETTLKGIPVHAAGTLTAFLVDKLIDKLSRKR